MGPGQSDGRPEHADREVNMGLEGERPGIPFKYVRQCNWAQALEGDIDSVHLNFLHTRLDRKDTLTFGDSTPYFQIVPTEYGHFFGARRTVGDKYYWRINQFAMP